MNKKDIQTLIEKEAEVYAETILPFMRDQSLYTHEMAYADCVKHGASFALSLFKWRKVSEGLPDSDEVVLVRTDLENVTVGFHHNVWYTYYELDDDADEIFTDWMPIPQID